MRRKVNMMRALYPLEPGASTGCTDDRHKLAGGQACAADQRAVDIVDRHQRDGIVRLDRAAIENADLPTLAGQEILQLVADKAVDAVDVVDRGRATGSDCPY